MSTASSHNLVVDRALLEKYDRPGPRYTSYPTAPMWSKEFGRSDYAKALADASTRPESPLSLYLHLPFCWERCLFCGCNVVISKRREVADVYLDYLHREIECVADALAPRKAVSQIHWGGGTPTYLSVAQMEGLMDVLRGRFDIARDAELALEVDPRVTTREQLDALRAMGFNRISMGVQDLDPDVQQAIARNQSEVETREMFRWCRDLEFGGINLDLIYGLPMQTAESWERTVRAVIDIRPDRLAVYSYAHLPDAIKHQRRIDDLPRPGGTEKYELFAEARRLFLDAGYRAIGFDHFALPTDELSRALDERRVHRNFMGYTVVPASEQIGLGASAISEVADVYAQNEKRPVLYYKGIDDGRFPTHTGIALSPDDRIRRWVIRELMCNFYLAFDAFEAFAGAGFQDYFAEECEALAPLEADGFFVWESAGLRVAPLGQVFVRNLCMVFDAYLRKPGTFNRFSRTV